MKRSLKALLCAAALTGSVPFALTSRAEEQAPSAAPQPDAVTNDWKFDFKYDTPNTIAIEDPDGTVHWYWYMTYRITNLDADELFFDPRIVIQTDAGDIVKANLGTDARVFKAVREHLRNPLLVSPVEVPGKVLKGEDYTRQSVAIWPVADKDVDEFKVFVGGIYGETKIVTDPDTGKPIMIPEISALTGEPKKDADGNPVMKPLELRRTKMLHFKTPGTTEAKQNPAIKLEADKDVMR